MFFQNNFGYLKYLPQTQAKSMSQMFVARDTCATQLRRRREKIFRESSVFTRFPLGTALDKEGGVFQATHKKTSKET